MVERKVGEKFRVDDITYVTVVDDEDAVACLDCVFYGRCTYDVAIADACGYCAAGHRSDRIGVHFKKGGE